MPVTLDPDLDRDALVSALGQAVDRQAVRTGESRRRRLQRNLRRLSRAWETTVRIDESIRTTELESTATSAYEVAITGRRVHQPVTDYDPRAWDWLVQRALAVHEAGHIRYTDYADWEARLAELDTGEAGVAHTLHNVLEDAAIETQIVRRWPNYDEPLRALRANLLEDASVGIPDPERGGFVYPLAHAVHASILDRWLAADYGLDLEVIGSLLDPSDPAHHFTTEADRRRFETELWPRLPGIVETVRSTPEATDRNAAIFEFVQTVLAVLADADADGRTQQNGRAGEGAAGEGMPDDSRNNDSGESIAPADALDAADAADFDPDERGPGDSAPDSAASVEVDPEIQAEAAEAAADDAREEADVTEAALEEYDELEAALAGDGNRAGDGLRSLDLVVPTESWTADPTVLDRVRSDYRPLARLFRNRLQHERRTKIRRGTRRGRLDSKRLYRTAIESNPGNLKRRREEPDRKDYYMAFVLDRSASMGRKIRQAELALGLLLYALEDVGVETAVFELYDSTVRIGKPFGVSSDSNRDRLFHGRTGGGTPLTTVLHVVRRRLNRESARETRRVMFVLTDDKPANPGSFSETIAATTFPVVGVNLADAPATGTYTRSVTASPGSDLQEKLRQLATEILV
ncbi:vWA domain-containing protein [Halodesulfurarchaeum formicicum]|uniref:von Willebrand factor type A n=1 Tax=Halodesulfurarchaeum formicicum TaxID=1873524 RepID=A0A1J1AB97_9EURY|nr:VWA domain-containing protein [Halodesulfurarchaeum formicicum]APE94841.1 von Willebrand factor type A [Halodesulfurarchaeum formicicum]